MIILPCPKRPDLDCIAGAYAYGEYLACTKQQTALAWIAGQPDGEAQFYLDLFPNMVFATQDDARRADAFVLIDFSVSFILPPEVDPQKVIQVIDHRDFTTPEADFPQAIIQIDLVGAAATQVTEYFMRDGLEPSLESAAMLYGAIYTHTLCLNSSTTTQRDRDAVTWLKQYVPDADELVQRQLDARAYEIVSQMPAILDTEMKRETSHFGQYGIVLIELCKSQAFWQKYREHIIKWADSKDFPVIVDILDPMENTSIIYSRDPDYTDMLEQKLPVKANDNVFMLQPAWFRKQIIPLLK